MTRMANDTCEWVESISQVMVILLRCLTTHRLAVRTLVMLRMGPHGPIRSITNTGEPPAARSPEYLHLYTERGLRGHFCDKYAPVTKVIPQPSFCVMIFLVRIKTTFLPTKNLEVTFYEDFSIT